MSIKQKLIVLLAIPLSAVIGLGGIGIMNYARISYEMGHVHSLAELAIHFSELVHETQKERGYTAGYLGSKGQEFQTELSAERKEADHRIAELNEYLKEFDADDFGTEFRSRFDAAMANLGQIAQKRQQVSALSISATDAIGFYTKMNGQFLDAVASIVTQSSNGTINQQVTAYSNFLKSKERAGVERAVLTNTFARDNFGPGMYAKFISLVTAQDLYANEFKFLADDDQTRFFEDRMGRPVVAEVQRMRDTASAKASEGGFGVDVGQWFDAITQKIDLLKEVEDKLSHDLEASSAAAKASADHTDIIFIIITVAAVAVSFVGGMLVVRSIVKPMNAILTRIKDIAEGEGDLTQRVDDKRRDEIGELGKWFNKFVDRIDMIIGEVSGAMSEVASASTEIAASSEEMAKGMTEQNREISQVSAAVEQMSASVIEVARKSGDAANNANEAGRAAETGGEVVEKTIDGMEAISAAVSASAASVTELGKRGEQIGQIIDVINDIADQTNLLALNAAIEAARAGEHGRGFAVVADEVRKLADRTTKATAEVAESINAIQVETSGAVDRMHAGTEEVKVGVGRATEAGHSLRQIVTSAKEVAGMIQSIAAAAEQQSAASEEVSRSITSIGSIVKVAEQGAQQAAEAVSSLAERSNRLQNMIGQFKTSSGAKTENAKWNRPAGEQTRILVVDDDPSIVSLLQGHLKDYGQCTTASNGSSAVSAFRGLLDQDKCFDLVCLDIKMPGMDGLEALNKIRELEKSYGVSFRQHSRVLMVTALDTPQDKLKAFKDACDGYLTKPFDKGQVERAVETVGIRKQGQATVELAKAA